MLVFCGGFAFALCWKWSQVTVRWQELTLTGRHPDYASGAVFSVAFSADGKMIASGSDTFVKIWDAATGADVSRFEAVC